MAHICSPITFSFANTGQTAMSLCSIWRIAHLGALPTSGDSAHIVYFMGHVTRFHDDNRCFNQGKWVFGKREPKFILDVY